MVDIPSSEELDSIFQGVKAILTHPEFRQALEEVSSLPPEQRAQALSTRLTPNALAARGVQIPHTIVIATDDIEAPSSSDDTMIDPANASASGKPGTITSAVDMHSFSMQVCLGPLCLPALFFRRRPY